MMRKWILENQIADENELDKIENKAVLDSKKSRDIAWKDYRNEIKEDLQDAISVLTRVAQNSTKNKFEIINFRNELNSMLFTLKSDIYRCLKKVLIIIRGEEYS